MFAEIDLLILLRVFLYDTCFYLIFNGEKLNILPLFIYTVVNETVENC